MSDITLSAAVRSNLLSLQNTASLLDTTQTRLATGNKVNSALDNPTNYFTASALNSRASDLGNLLDGVSNAIQTIQAANDGITSITKLVESAQATANQAQQLSATVATAAGAAVNTGTVDLRDTPAGATAAVKTGTVDIRDVSTPHAAISTGTVAISDDVPATSTGTVDLSTSLGTAAAGQGLSITLGGVTKTVTFTTGGGGTGDIDLDPATDTGASFVTALNTAFGAGTASLDGSNHLVLNSTGANPITITDTGTAGAKAALGLSDAAATSSVVSGLSGALSIQVGSTTANVTVPGAGSTKADLLTAINSALGATATAAYDGSGHLQITAANTTDSITFGGAAGNLTALGETTTATAPTSTTAGSTAITGLSGSLTIQIGTGSAATVSLSGVTDQTSFLAAVNTAIGATGSASIDTSGHLKITAANTTDSITYGGAAGNLTGLGVDTTAAAPGTTAASNATIAGLSGSLTVTIGSAAAATVNLTGVTDDASLLSAINTAIGTTGTASIDSTTGHLKITAANTTDSVTFGGAAGNLTALGVTTTAAAPTAASSGVNPARAAYISQYNGLLDQIDQLTADAGYNGNNLLAGTSSQLKVLFNEAGSSSLTISGKDTTATGLGLAKLTVGTEFDTNASITGILAKLKTATDTLRSDASSFGSNLSIVQTRQDFTKNLINTLQTGASNLTLADSNEEAANLLALQTRQSLSTKALSLASQSDQNVLRLLQ